MPTVSQLVRFGRKALFKKTKEVPDFLIKDCTTRQRPKIEEYTGTLSIVLHGVSGGMRPDQVNLIVGKNYVLALFKENDPAIAKAEEFLSKNPASIRAMGTGYVLYGFVDAIVGNYRPVIEADFVPPQIELNIAGNVLSYDTVK